MKIQHQLINKTVLLISLVATLSACTSVSTPTSVITPAAILQAPTWAERQPQLSSLTAWQLQGAMGVQQNTKRWSASVNWQQQNASNYKIRLYGPFGAGAVELQGKPGQVSLVSNQNPKPVIANNPEVLIAKETGWQLPVSNLYYWVRSIPAPGSSAQLSFDELHRVSQLKQDGWQVQYLDYRTVNGMDLPAKMLLTNAPFTIKLVIKQWQPAR